MKLHLFHFYSEVIFINVGQGDSILIKLPMYHYYALIDTGKKRDYYKLKNTLFALGIDHLDDLIITHYDEDHSGSLDELMVDFNVNRLLDYTNFPDSLEAPFQVIQLNPMETSLDENDHSLVLLFQINQLRFLLMGDASKEIEKRIVNQQQFQVDLLKVGHHGSNTSTSYELLDYTNPLVAVISAGVNNRYGHPHPDVITRLTNSQIHILNTQTQGDIHIIFLPMLNFALTSSHDFVIIKWK